MRTTIAMLMALFASSGLAVGVSFTQKPTAKGMIATTPAIVVGTARKADSSPSFVKKPAAARVGDQVKIEFTVDRETDVTVSVEDQAGKVVRRLVSGVLGKNPPTPLKPGLAQSITWDGKADWGKPAPAGPLKVRVALGLGARYDKEVIADPMTIGDIQGLATGPDGTLYVVARVGAGVPNFGGQRLLALNRDGSYQRTLIPPPATVSKEQIEALGGAAVQVGGRIVPMVLHLAERRSTAFNSSDVPAVTPDGAVLVLDPDARIGLVDTTGGKDPPAYLGPKLLPDTRKASFLTIDHRKFLAMSADGKTAYFSGVAPERSWSSRKVPPYPAVYRVKLPERSPAELFFGDPARAGNDATHLGSYAHGMAADGKGNLLIGDPVNNRVVVVAEATGSLVGSFAAKSAEFIAADGTTGAIYVLRLGKAGAAEIAKLHSWKDPRELAIVRLAAPSAYLRWRFAADTAARPTVLWASNERQLFRIEDTGEEFSGAKLIRGSDIGDGGFVNLSVDHWGDDPEVYVRAGSYWWIRYNEKTGGLDFLRNLSFNSGACGSCLEVGPDGNLYTQAWPMFLHKWDRAGKRLKWESPFAVPEGIKPYPGDSSNAIYMPVCMVFMTHTLGIRSDGHLFAFERKPATPERVGFKALFEYDASGKRLGGPIIWQASDAVIGPRFDQQGNIYIAEPVRPAGQMGIPEFAGVTGPVTRQSHWDWEPKGGAAWYGSILKFSPKGGMIEYKGPHYSGQVTGPQAYDGRPKLDASLKTIDAACFAAGSSEFTFAAVKITGAEWMHFGVSQIFLGKCNCENTRFDVDPFGRVWYPDLGRYRVGVLDTNGNLITTFGGYGNAESRGPDSPVVDRKTGKVRPRRPDDPKDLKSPFAEPEIAFAWLIGVGATDKYAYMGDSLNRRLLRAKLVYAAEEVCEVR